MSQTIYEALLNSNAVVEFDIRGRILWANQNFLNLLGYNLEEIFNQPHSIFLPHFAEYQNEYESMWELLTQGQSHAGEFKRIRKDQSPIWIQGSYTPVRNSQGEIFKIVKMAVDVTEKKRLAENLEKKNHELAASAEKAKAATHAKSVFLANMSHEIRTPLNSIIGITDTLAETSLDDRQASFVEILQRANIQLMTIINDILDLSKVEAGEIELQNKPFDLKKVIEDLIALLGFRAKEKGLLLKLELPQDMETLYSGDAGRLRQVLLNLLNNAIKFTHTGMISIRVEDNITSKNGNLLFSVADTGIGIPKSKFNDIFNPFTQADATATRRYGGTGLGLCITKNLVNLMGGSIWLTSELGRGSVFYFTVSIPRTSISPATEVNSPLALNDIKHKISKNRLRILVVDDVEDNRKLFGIYLQNTVHQIYYAQDGVEALDIAKKESFDIIFMDVQMPGMDGYETTRHIRQFEKDNGKQGARIFACTANAFSEDVARSLEAGCDLHLSKPIRKDLLLMAINSALNPEKGVNSK